MPVEQPTLTELTTAQIAELEGLLTNFVANAGDGDGRLPITLDMTARHGSHAEEASARA